MPIMVKNCIGELLFKSSINYRRIRGTQVMDKIFFKFAV